MSDAESVYVFDEIILETRDNLMLETGKDSTRTDELT